MYTKKEHGSLLYKMADLNKSIFDGYNSEIYRILNKSNESATLTSNSDKLGGLTLNEILDVPRDLISEHEGDKNNPHLESYSSIGSLTVNQINSLLSNKLETSIVPVYVYGYNRDTWDLINPGNFFNLSGSNIIVSSHDVVFTGTEYKIESTTIDLTEYSNREVFLFLERVDEKVKVKVSDEYINESKDLAFIGSIHTGTGNKNIERFIRLGLYRTSVERKGTTIPVHPGTFLDEVGLSPDWKPDVNEEVNPPQRPPDVDIRLLTYDKSTDGRTGFIDWIETDGSKVLVLNTNVEANLDFIIEGSVVNVVESYIRHSGTNPIVTMVGFSRIRVRATAYTRFDLVVTVENSRGETASVKVPIEIRDNLTVRLYTYDNSYITARPTGGVMSLVYLSGGSQKELRIIYTGTGATANHTVMKVSGNGTLNFTKDRDSVYRFRTNGIQNSLITFTVTDKYNRTANLSVYLESINQKPTGRIVFDRYTNYSTTWTLPVHVGMIKVTAAGGGGGGGGGGSPTGGGSDGQDGQNTTVYRSNWSQFTAEGGKKGIAGKPNGSAGGAGGGETIPGFLTKGGGGGGGGSTTAFHGSGANGGNGGDIIEISRGSSGGGAGGGGGTGGSPTGEGFIGGSTSPGSGYGAYGGRGGGGSTSDPSSQRIASGGGGGGAGWDGEAILDYRTESSLSYTIGKGGAGGGGNTGRGASGENGKLLIEWGPNI